MRSAQTQNITINYPSSTTFAFNRNLVAITLLPQDLRNHSIAFFIGDFPKDIRKCDSNGKIQIDISRYLQLCFDRQDILRGDTTKTIIVSIYDDDEQVQLFTFSIDVVWGGVSAGDTIQDSEEEYDYNERNGYITYMALANYNTFIRSNNGNWVNLGSNEETGFKTLNISQYFGEDDKVILQQIQCEQSTFDDSFDFTFLYKVLSRYTKTYKKPKCTNEGVAVKWIDNYGVTHNRRFLRSAYNVTSSAYGETLNDYAYKSAVFAIPVTYQQGITGTQELTLAVPFANKEEWVVLKSLLTSSCVQYFGEDGEWYAATIKGGTTTIPNGMDDFVVTLQIPNIVTQRF